MAIHVAELALMQFNNITGEVFQKGSSTMKKYISTPAKPVTRAVDFETQVRVIEDSDIGSSTGNPTIKEYLILEDAAGFTLVHIDQSYIITTGP
jgi:hypothetical protein